MSCGKNRTVTILLVVSVSLISTMLTAMLLTKHYSDLQFQLLGGFCRMLTEENVSERGALMEALKKNRESLTRANAGNFLEGFGYVAADFTDKRWELGYLIAAAALSAGVLMFLSAFFYWLDKERRHMQALTQYLEKVNAGGQGILAAAGEEEGSRLQDEIYKTVTALYQTRDVALAAKENYAENLYHIAHQIKTPITAISLSAQMIEGGKNAGYAKQIRKQAVRLTHLAEALLLLARIDAGTLTLERIKTDVYTVLMLAADNLQELAARSGITFDIPEAGEAEFQVDVEWTMEAVINLFKNCMEHSPAGSKIHCSYEQNPLYVQIRIWDEGKGFEKEDIPHLFERFYRGKNAAKGGIGIGLALSRAIIEKQNGVISAANLPEGGACFEIRMYSH